MWIVYALLAAVCYSSATMTSKYSVSKVVRDQQGIVIVHTLAALFWIALLWLIVGRPGLSSSKDLFLGVGSGVLMGLGAFYYFKVFKTEDASVVTLLIQATVPMTLIASYIFLGDSIGLLQLFAAALILSGVVIASWSRKGFHLHSTTAIPLMLATTVLTTAMLVISKSVVEHNNTIAYTFYQAIGFVLFGLVLTLAHHPTRAGFKENMRPFHPKMLLVIASAELLYTLAILSQFKAFTYVNAGLVISVGASEVFISIIIGVLMTRLLPHIINEKIDRKTISRKFAAGCLIASGIVMLNFV